MKVQYGGQAYDLDLTDIELKPAVVITSHTGMSLRQWGEALQDDLEPDGETVKLASVDKPEFLPALRAVFWLMLQQNGEPCPIGDVNFRVGAFTEALGAAMVAEVQAALEAENAQKAAEPDPTPPPGSAPSPEPWSLTDLTPMSTDGGGMPDG